MTDDSGVFLTVGDLRAAMADLPDDAQICLTTVGFDQGVTNAQVSRLIPWDHDCVDAPAGHKRGRDCPTVWSLELWTDTYDEALLDASVSSVTRANDRTEP